MKKILLLITCFFCLQSLEANFKNKKVLHLTFHKGCQKEIESLSDIFSFDLTTWFIPDHGPLFLDGVSKGNALYNIGHERAENIWNLHQSFFDQFDLIITSDTAPLARIFLQNNWEKPLIIWVCNRFDYCDGASLDCEFPDPEYYELFQKATTLPNVHLIAYTAFEAYYAKNKDVIIDQVISPCCPKTSRNSSSYIPEGIDKRTTFFLPPYHNETLFMDMQNFCNAELKIPSYCGRYNGSSDLNHFKGIIHLPYAWSNLALFENIQLGIPYFLPSESFFKELVESDSYFFTNLPVLLKEDLLSLSEWYSEEHKPLFIYFDSWEDLKEKISKTNFRQKRKEIQRLAQLKKKQTLEKWKKIFSSSFN